MNELLFHNLHLPYEVRTFDIPKVGIKRFDNKYLVYDVLIDKQTILRHYSFKEYWFEINISFDMDGEFLQELDKETNFVWSYNFDICSPFFVEKGQVYNVDLMLDVLVRSDGSNYLIKDEEEFLEGYEMNWFSEYEKINALESCNKLVSIINEYRLRSFLEEIYPFQGLNQSGLQPKLKKSKLMNDSILEKNKRMSFY
ncbi:DUF402 domain-containing protein [Alkalicoccobacillus plakortidis]|uniref:DUF402 domain-containing protein n=1 Tax=Alkalicoccobacillus plakortidis TaxID=444060 RepID=A0ABT0XGB2_9BACI|nr:DUF402 domain-containing protein [Alkalicoccobacillus plakortidis]MCM2674932.1 DUF402 domain-containing protein [Alkalicoccobacillus plakortidis]